jgi:hypothetical protein
MFVNFKCLCMNLCMQKVLTYTHMYVPNVPVK